MWPAEDSRVAATTLAFHGRVSTEDHKDPQVSRSWQLARALGPRRPAGGRVVAEFFDVAVSKPVPWKRRPQAARLLDEARRSPRRFDARGGGVNRKGRSAAGDAQRSDGTLRRDEPRRTHPDRDPHAQHDGRPNPRGEGRYLGGHPPYGYRLADAWLHPHRDKAAIGNQLHRLEGDPETGPTGRADLRRVPCRPRHDRHPPATAPPTDTAPAGHGR